MGYSYDIIIDHLQKVKFTATIRGTSAFQYILPMIRDKAMNEVIQNFVYQSQIFDN